MLFRCDSNYQETRLLRDPFRPAIYLTLDFWKSGQACNGFLAAHRAEYKKLDALGEGLTINERRAGDYEFIAP